MSVCLSALIPLECLIIPPWMHHPSLNASSKPKGERGPPAALKRVYLKQWTMNFVQKRGVFFKSFILVRTYFLRIFVPQNFFELSKSCLDRHCKMYFFKDSLLFLADFKVRRSKAALNWLILQIDDIDGVKHAG